MAHVTRSAFYVAMLSVVMSACSLTDIKCPEETDCDGVCADLSKDNEHCGECGHACKNGEKCEDGACVVSCVEGQIACEGQCINLQSDIKHCGTCGNACKNGESCVDGACVVTCGERQEACEGQCVDLQSDVKHCGTCGNACKNGESCVDGMCVISCPEKQVACGEKCIDTLNDAKNCGDCGHACDGRQMCDKGACVCQEGLVFCSSKCIDLNDYHLASCTECRDGFMSCDENMGNGCEISINDNNNCGKCGKKCDSSEVCSNGTCASNCGDGEEKCGASCINLNDLHMKNCNECLENYCDGDNNLKNGCEIDMNGSDDDNCGACGKKCDVKHATNFCTEGSCGFKCDSGYHEYFDICEQDDMNNCGSHGNLCITPENGYVSCNNGNCRYSCMKGYHLYNNNRCEEDSILNCGEHGNICDNVEHASALCMSGTCGFKCDDGYKKSKSTCVSVCSSEKPFYCKNGTDKLCCSKSTCVPSSCERALDTTEVEEPGINPALP